MKMSPATIQFTALLAMAASSALTLDAAALAQERSKNDEPIDMALTRVPEKARAKRNPLETDSEAACAGKRLFEQHCAGCHGKMAEGTRRGPGLREMQPATPGEIFWIVTNGVVRHGMPAWSKLPEPQRWQIITFLRGLGVTPAVSCR